MATDDQQILVTGHATTPASWPISGTGQVRPKTVFATFDGTGAAGNFIPALKIVSDGGKTIGIYKADDTVTAGASADVSWFPHVAPAAQAAASGIQYDVLNDGGWLSVRADSNHNFVNDHGDAVNATEYFETNGSGGFTVEDYGGGGITMRVAGDGGISMRDDGTGGISFGEDGTGGISLRDGDGVVAATGIRITEEANGNGIVIRDNSTGGLFITGASTGGLAISDSGGGGTSIVTSAAGLFIFNLPTVVPGGSKQIWNNGGVLTITP